MLSNLKKLNLKKKGLVLSVLVSFLFFSFALANQGLDFEIVANLGTSSEEPILFLRTLEGASSGLDNFDQAVPSHDKMEIILRSTIGNDNNFYIVDFWDAKQDSDRTIGLKFEVVGNIGSEGFLNLSWNSSALQDSDGRYFFLLKDYGNGSILNNSINMNDNSSYSVWNEFDLRYFEIETDYKYCGDGVCSSWENNLNCPSDCSTSPSGPSGPGGPSGPSPDPDPSCENECSSGQRECVSGSSYRVCGDFNNDGCFEWGSSETCLAVNPFCLNGFCYGCLTNSDCGVGYDCIGNSCVDPDQEDRDDDDFEDVPENRIEDNWRLDDEGNFVCNSNFECSVWSECIVSYSPSDLIMGRSWFTGIRSRLCFDLNNCFVTKEEKEVCSLKVEVYSKEVSLCGKKYIEIYEKGTDKLLASTSDSRYGPKRSIEIFLLPEEIDCEEIDEDFIITWLDRLMFVSNIKNTWRLFP